MTTTTTAAVTTTEKQYYVTAEIKPDGSIENIRIDVYPTIEHARSDSHGHVKFMRRCNQRKPPYGQLETKPLLMALAAWPMQVLKAIAGSRYGYLHQNMEDMPRGLRPLGDDTDGLIAAVNRCALNKAGDDDRILLARKNRRGDTMFGPCELVECSKHPSQHELHRWTWDVPEDGDHVCAIECGSEGEVVTSCTECIKEENAADDDL